MLEIPESKTISAQAKATLAGKIIAEVIPASSPHKFAGYLGDPARYPSILTGRKVISAKGHGMFVDLCLDSDSCITICDGTNLRFYASGEERPEKHQLMILFDDQSAIAFTIAMYGAIWAYQGTSENKYYQRSLASTSPVDDAFDESFFDNLFRNTTKDLSMKALLATEQRIPGLGNGVLQDILFNAGIHPKRKKSTLSDFDKSELFHSLKVTLKNMTELGGRDTEKDLFGRNGKYKTILSKNTVNHPCPNCGGAITKEAYMGGAVYYCKVCQK